MRAEAKVSYMKGLGSVSTRPEDLQPAQQVADVGQPSAVSLVEITEYEDVPLTLEQSGPTRNTYQSVEEFLEDIVTLSWQDSTGYMAMSRQLDPRGDNLLSTEDLGLGVQVVSDPPVLLGPAQSGLLTGGSARHLGDAPGAAGTLREYQLTEPNLTPLRQYG